MVLVHLLLKANLDWPSPSVQSPDMTSVSGRWTASRLSSLESAHLLIVWDDRLIYQLRSGGQGGCNLAFHAPPGAQPWLISTAAVDPDVPSYITILKVGGEAAFSEPVSRFRNAVTEISNIERTVKNLLCTLYGFLIRSCKAIDLALLSEQRSSRVVVRTKAVCSRPGGFVAGMCKKRCSAG
jgi:hypothetical protein